MSKASSKIFNDFSIEQFYPQDHVAEHEVFISFNGDDQAIAFQEWLDEEGWANFTIFLNNRKGVTQ